MSAAELPDPYGILDALEERAATGASSAVPIGCCAVCSWLPTMGVDHHSYHLGFLAGRERRV